LHRFIHVDDQHSVDPGPSGRCRKKRDNEDTVRAPRDANLALCCFGDPRMQNGFEPALTVSIGENGFPHFLPIQPSGHIEKVLAERLDDFPQCRPAGFDNLVRYAIGIDDCDAVCSE
jgi:hypothetical protein